MVYFGVSYMSKVPSLLNSLKQQQDLLRSIRESIERDVGSLLEQMNLIVDRMSQINELTEVKIKEQADKEKISAELDATLNGLREEKSGFEKKLQDNKDANRAKQEQIRSLSAEQISLDKELNSSQSKLGIVNGEIQKFKKEDERLTTTLQMLNSRHQKNVESLEDELGAEGRKAQMLQKQLRSLKFLIVNNAVEIPEMKIIDAMKDRVATNKEFLLRATAMKESIIEEVLFALNKKGVVRYNQSTGEITVLQKMEI